MKIPIEQQRLRRDPIEILETTLRVRGQLSGHDVRAALELAIGTRLSSLLREHVERLTEPRGSGRPAREPSVRAREEFAMEELDARYQVLRSEFKAKGPGSDRRPPSERAYLQLARELKEDFGNIDWRALQNKHSAWRTGRLYASEEPVDSEDFDVEVGHQFPSHNNQG